MEKTSFIEKHAVAIFKALQIIFMLLAITNAALHCLVGVLTDMAMYAAMELFVKVVHLCQKRRNIIEMLIDMIEKYKKELKKIEQHGN